MCQSLKLYITEITKLSSAANENQNEQTKMFDHFEKMFDHFEKIFNHFQKMFNGFYCI
jgi:DNA-binding protein H-NS